MVLKYVLGSSVFIILLVCATAVTPLAEAPLQENQGGCKPKRDLLRTCWSCILTIAALTADYYGVFGFELYRILDSPRDVFSILVYVFSVPLLHPSNLLRKAMQARIIMFPRLQRKGVDVTREACKIVISCNVFVDLPVAEDVYADFHEAHPFGKVKKLYGDRRLKEAVELPCLEWNKEGACCQNHRDNRQLIELNLAGKEWLLQSGLLPPAEQLRFFQTINAATITLSAIQAAGFLLAIGVRFAQHLKVSPLEALATPMAVVVLLQAGLHRWVAGSSNRIMIIHLHADSLTNWESGPLQQHLFDYETAEKRVRVGVVAVLLGVFVGPTVPFGIYFYKIHNEHGIDVSALTFQIAMVTYFAMLTITREKDTKWSRKTTWARVWACITMSLLTTSLAFAIVYTVRQWDTFSPDSNLLTQFIIPHI